tara:strand:- start:157 stop:930 length:774 start_codon:yes stop_codon:yes gene_type:complete
MKKKLESELISIAHRVLKLTGKEDLNKMQDEVAVLYQKISILKFLQTHFNGEIPEEVATDSSFFNSLKGVFINNVSGADDVDEKSYSNTTNEPGEPLMEPAIEKIKDIVAQMPQETAAVDALVDDANSSDVIEEDLAELSPNLGQLPIFEPLQSDSEPEEALTADDSLMAIKKTSLDEKLKKTGFQIGLNDRLAFVNHLFQNNNEDYDRVISQLNTMDSFEEISDFIQNIIKPDYSNWEDKGDYETRFLEILQQKFN